jgi:hypothetical protein
VDVLVGFRVFGGLRGNGEPLMEGAVPGPTMFDIESRVSKDQLALLAYPAPGQSFHCKLQPTKDAQ